MSRQPHVSTLFTFDGDPEVARPDPMRAIGRAGRRAVVGALAAVLALGAAFALRTPVADEAAAPPAPLPVVTRTPQACAPGVWCSPSAEVAAGEALRNPSMHLCRSRDAAALAARAAGLACGPAPRPRPRCAPVPTDVLCARRTGQV